MAKAKQLRELRKIVERLRALADEIEKERSIRRFHREWDVRGVREANYNRKACGLLMATLEHGGLADEKLRVILLSWRGKDHASFLCLRHMGADQKL